MALRVGVQPAGDLLIFQGPLLLVPTARPAKLFLEVENAEIHAAVPVTPRRVDAWMRANIHVEGRPEWRFVKIHTHGASAKEDADEILGPELDRALTYMEKTYNDGAHYVLHYVTAREAFNVARAAVDGKAGRSAAVLRLPDSAVCGECEALVRTLSYEALVAWVPVAPIMTRPRVSASAGVRRLSRQQPPFHHCGRLFQISRIGVVLMLPTGGIP